MLYDVLSLITSYFADGDDYTYTYTSDSLDDNDSSDCSSVPIISDSIDEEEECFTVSLSTTTSLSGLTIHPRIGTVCINDDDRESVVLSLIHCITVIIFILSHICNNWTGADGLLSV